MSGWAQYAPTALQAYGTYSGGKADATALRLQAYTAQRQAKVDEDAQRRVARQVLGEQAAAFAQAGGGVDENIMRQSAINAELDALNIRYGGAMKASGLLSDARATRKQSAMLAGAQLLSGTSSAYTRGRTLSGGYG
jgi:hypothetical protein